MWIVSMAGLVKHPLALFAECKSNNEILCNINWYTHTKHMQIIFSESTNV
jgi:hypothetical protein